MSNPQKITITKACNGNNVTNGSKGSKFTLNQSKSKSKIGQSQIDISCERALNDEEILVCLGSSEIKNCCKKSDCFGKFFRSEDGTLDVNGAIRRFRLCRDRTRTLSETEKGSYLIENFKATIIDYCMDEICGDDDDDDDGEDCFGANENQDGSTLKRSSQESTSVPPPRKKLRQTVSTSTTKFKHCWLLPVGNQVVCRKTWAYLLNFSKHDLDSCSTKLHQDYDTTVLAHKPFKDTTLHPYTFSETQAMFANNTTTFGIGTYFCLL
jgi:hypothetical protein